MIKGLAKNKVNPIICCQEISLLQVDILRLKEMKELYVTKEIPETVSSFV